MNPALGEYARILRRRWRWVAAGTLLGLAVVGVLMVVQPPLYRSEAVLFVRTPGDVSRVQDGGDSYAQSRAGTYAALARSVSIASRAVADLGLDVDARTVARRVEAARPNGTALITLAVSAPSSDQARQLATVYVSEFSDSVRSLEAVPGSLVPRAELVVVDPPGPPVRVVAWGAPVYLVLIGAALLGLFGGALAATVYSILRPEPHTDPAPGPELDATDPPAPTPDVAVSTSVPSPALAPDQPRGRHRRLRRELLGNGESEAPA